MIFNQEINKLFIEVFENILHEESNNIKELGLNKITLNEIHVLAKIRDLQQKKEKVIPKDLLKILNITKGTLSVVITRLEKKGYLEKRKNMTDRRSFSLELNKEAKEALDKHDKWHDLLVKVALKNLDLEEKKILKKILQTIKDNMEDIIK